MTSVTEAQRQEDELRRELTEHPRNRGLMSVPEVADTFGRHPRFIRGLIERDQLRVTTTTLKGSRTIYWIDPQDALSSMMNRQRGPGRPKKNPA